MELGKFTSSFGALSIFCGMEYAMCEWDGGRTGSSREKNSEDSGEGPILDVMTV